jgi:hypothetical protein
MQLGDMKMTESDAIKEALEKQIPQEVVNQGGTPLSGYCPRCNAQLTKPSSPVGCKWCLLRLKWEGEQEDGQTN